jgi:hypothetical protein
MTGKSCRQGQQKKPPSGAAFPPHPAQYRGKITSSKDAPIATPVLLPSTAHPSL